MKFLKRSTFIIVGWLMAGCVGWCVPAFEKASLLLKQALLQSQGVKQKKVLEFYQKNNFQPAWFEAEGWHLRRMVAYKVLQQADIEGLNPSDYAYGWQPSEDTDPLNIAEADVRLTRAIIDYMDDIKGDRFDPKKIHKDIHFQARNFEAATVLFQNLQQDGTASFLRTFTLAHPTYQRLKSLLQQLKEEGTDYPFFKLPPGKVLKKGMTDSRIPLIGVRLGVSQADKFDASLEEAVKAFQQAQGLEMDGVVGERTLRALNKTSLDRIYQVLATMEKWRWIPEELPRRYVVVNIPSFTLYAYEEGKQVIEMKVIIGKALRPTPLFSSVINEVRFNPAWHVPRSIAVKDKLKIIQEDPSYLTRKGFKVYDEEGKSIAPLSVNWSSLSASNFPYKLVQDPGDANALGKIRFNIISPFDIYLHSTSEPQLFKKNVRSFSSGCIRIEKPEAMGVYALNDSRLWPLAAVKKAMEGNQTRDIKLEEPLPIFITYFTVWFDKANKPVFADDIYNQDHYLIQAMIDNKSKAILR